MRLIVAYAAPSHALGASPLERRPHENGVNGLVKDAHVVAKAEGQVEEVGITRVFSRHITASPAERQNVVQVSVAIFLWRGGSSRF